MKRLGVAVLLAAAGLAGCVSADAPMQMNGTREEATARCVKKVETWGIGVKTEASQFMGVSKERVPAVFCQRMVAAIESGRITGADFAGLRREHSSRIWKVIKRG
jgi:hypothetical protein